MSKPNSINFFSQTWQKIYTGNGIISGLFILSIFSCITATILVLRIFFDFSMPPMLGKEYHKGIPIPIVFYTSNGSDTTVLVREKKRVDGVQPYSIFKNDEKGNPVPVQWGLPVELSSATIEYRDSIFPYYQTTNTRPPWNDSRSNVTKVKFEKGTAYIKPHTFSNRIILLLPQALFWFLIMYCCWQLALFLDNIQRNRMFVSQNHTILKRIAFSILIYQAVLLALYLLGQDFSINIDYRSTIPHYRSPILVMAEPDYHLGWEYIIAASVILIIAKAFQRGSLLQKEQELTI